ncbi:hypothetical protein [Pseudomonas gingeri]
MNISSADGSVDNTRLGRLKSVNNSSENIEQVSSADKASFKKIPSDDNWLKKTNPFYDKGNDQAESIEITKLYENKKEVSQPVEGIERNQNGNPFEDQEGAVVVNPREGISTKVSQDFIDAINTYLRIDRHGNDAGINDKHVKKIKNDLGNSQIFSQFIVLKGEKGKEFVQWKDQPPGKEDFQRLLQAFRPLHDVKGSFYTVLTNAGFAREGFRLLDDVTHERIIREAARPDIHRPGKGAVVEMKRNVMTSALEYLSHPQHHHTALPEGTVDKLVKHYGRVEEHQDQARLSAQKLAEQNKLSLNDRGIGEKFKRLFFLVKTEARLRRFDKDVEEAGKEFREKMLKELDSVHREHDPQAVAVRTKNKLEEHLRKAHTEYAREMKGENIFPRYIGKDAAEQIESKTQENFHEVLRSIVFDYEKEFVGDMAKAVSSFSPSDYFKRKSLERTVDNIISINDNLSELYHVADEQHKGDMRDVMSRFGEKAVKGLPEKFDELKAGLANNIKKKVLSNYGDVLHRYEERLDKLQGVKSPDSLVGKLKLARELIIISRLATADLNKIREHNHAAHLNLQPSELEPVLQAASQKVQDKVQALLPKPMNFKAMLKVIFVRPFKLTTKNIVIGAAVAAVSTLVLVALPAVVAGLVGIALIAGLSVAALGWFGRNLYRGVSQSNELNKLRAQVEKQWGDFEAGSKS